MLTRIAKPWGLLVLFSSLWGLDSGRIPRYNGSLALSVLGQVKTACSQGAKRKGLIMKRFATCMIAVLTLLPSAFAAQFQVGFAKTDITPTKPMPMWGYGARHDALSEGVRDPLFAKAVVIDVGEDKLALVGIDLGRSPRPEMMDRIRAAVKESAGVNYVMLSGSHTHHGPVIELQDEEGKGKGRFDDAVAYAAALDGKLIAVINEAAGNVRDARIGWGSSEVLMNRNRQTKLEPKATDSELSVIRFDDLEGKPIALLVNYAAHPTMLPGGDLRFSAEWPGQMMYAVEEAMDTNVGFLQGAAGDMSCKPSETTKGIELFGKAIGEEAVKIAEAIKTQAPEAPSIQGMDEDFEFNTRIPVDNPLVAGLLAKAFFPEFGKAAFDEMKGNKITPHLTTILVNKELALVGGSGEFFCNHANRLKARARDVKTIFVGYCNGHHMYFPTIEAASEGGYGADPSVSWVPLGAGEEMMNKALINIYTMLGKYDFKLSDS
jgi:neutral ceramidase